MTSNLFESLVKRLQQKAETSPATIGYTFLHDGIKVADTLTYGELEQRSREIAVMLLRVLNPGDRALLMYPPGLDFVSAFFGCLYAGVIAVPAYPPSVSRPERSMPGLRAIACEAEVAAILCPENETMKLASLFHGTELVKFPLLATDHYGLEQVGDWKPETCEPNAIAFLQFTSGSTASPKGVAVSHRNIIHNLDCIRRGSQHDANTVLVSWLPTYHDMGLFAGVMFPLFKGSPSYLMSPVSFLQKPIRWLQAISTFRGTNSGGPNFAYDLCVQRTTTEQKRELDLSCWQLAFNGAEPVQQSTIDDFSTKFHDCGFRRSSFFPVYGLAESTVFVAGRSQTDAPENATATASQIDENECLGKPVSCGSPIRGMQIAIVDPQKLTAIADGQIGEIWVSGPSVAKGYWNRRDETQATFQAFLSNSNQGPYLRTGDLGFMHDGEVYVTGRIKDLIIIRGRNHYPQEIERTVESSHAGIRPKCSAAISLPSSDGECLAIVAEINRRASGSHLNPGHDNPRQKEIDEIIFSIRQSIAEQHDVQTSVVSILARGDIPKTSSGKIKRHACRMAILSGTLKNLAHWSMPSKNSKRLESKTADPKTVTYA